MRASEGQSGKILIYVIGSTSDGACTFARGSAGAVFGRPLTAQRAQQDRR